MSGVLVLSSPPANVRKLLGFAPEFVEFLEETRRVSLNV
jgi:hypothetical protein